MTNEELTKMIESTISEHSKLWAFACDGLMKQSYVEGFTTGFVIGALVGVVVGMMIASAIVYWMTK